MLLSTCRGCHKIREIMNEIKSEVNHFSHIVSPYSIPFIINKTAQAKMTTLQIKCNVGRIHHGASNLLLGFESFICAYLSPFESGSLVSSSL